MRKLLALASLAITLSVSGLAQAELKGDPAAGREMAQSCAACHGAEGISAVGMFPNLAGQQASYLAKQIMDIRDGNRVVAQMAGQVDNFSDQDAADVAAYFASKPSNLGQIDAEEEVIARGQQLYRAGDMAKGIPACTACHSPTGQGIGTAAYPALSGQKTDYTVSTLKAFAAGERANDPNAIMRTIAGKMSDDDMQAVSQYLLGLH
ncbi:MULTISPECIES: c-type cytochrome [Halomonadaceae]|uniref:c-type cytochrome n=1 Tax=Halomonadaceae TaxID=28256 RepID=UPI001584415F|nr:MULTISPECIES: c-type cytochrome [Halomonas]MDI4636563.1 cytochrome c4 [Halomonas sp. BMC7]NUJ60928.1 cytochrome c4 [Halomonas taeanensis]